MHPMPHTLEAVLAACSANRERDLNDLYTLLRQPSISAQNIGIRETADLLKGMLDAIGGQTRFLETSVHPLVYAEFPGPAGAPTVLFYGHYDVQPPEPLDEWLSPPFEPTIRDGRIYARGVCDNKGQHFAHIAAVRAWLETAGALPVNVKFILEGEEETGSPHIGEIVENYRDLLAADLVVTSDGPSIVQDRPAITYGVRGVISFELVAKGAVSDLHSGNWGGVAPNPAWKLVHLLATMLSPDNVPLIDGFMDDVRPMPEASRRAIHALPITKDEMLASIGLAELPPPADVPLFDRLMGRPTITINGLTSGYQGKGGKTVLPNRASVKIDCRLVPDQDPQKILDLVRAHVARVAPDVEFIASGGQMRPSSTPLDHPFAGAVRAAVTIGFGVAPVEIPLMGGSLPDAVWTKDLGLPSFVVPYGVPDQRNHAPNENMPVANFYNGIRSSAALLAELAK
jgi:acetylornithine deacetylase/succinyl-diaminopimelate desuccinylase-like protein